MIHMISLILMLAFSSARCEENAGIVIELDLPSHMAEMPRKPQKLFAGRRIRVTSPLARDASKEVYLELEGSGLKVPLALQGKKNTETSFAVEIPSNTPSGLHRLGFRVPDGTELSVQLNIFGSGDDVREVRAAQSSPSISLSAPEALHPAQEFAVAQRVWIPGSAFWEMVFTGDPNDSSRLVTAGINNINRSIDGGQTWTTDSLSNITDFEAPRDGFSGDPKIVGLEDGSFLLSGLYVSTSKWGGALIGGGYSGRLQGRPFHKVTNTSPPDGYPWLLIDYPKLAARGSNVYISGNHTWLEDLGRRGKTLHISRDGGRTFSWREFSYDYTITSMDIGDDGNLYATNLDSTLLRFTSLRSNRP